MGSLIAGIIMAAAAATAAAIDYAIDASDERDRIEAERENQKERRGNELALLELNFEEAKKEANKNADRADVSAELSDKEQNLNENYLSNQFNNELNQLENQQKQDAFDWNVYSMNIGGEKGNALNELSTSGVRTGSSMQDAIDMQAAVNSQQLEMNINTSRNNQNYQLNQITNGIDLKKLNITGNRISADYQRQDALDLRNSYNENGYNWNVYQSKIKDVNNTYEYNMNTLDRQYKNVDLGNWRFWVGLNNKLLGGATSGFQTGYNIGNSLKEYKTTTE